MRLEPIDKPSLARSLLPPVIALGATVAIASFLAMLAGANPFSVFGLILNGAFGSKFAILETLNRATPLIFTGLANRLKKFISPLPIFISAKSKNSVRVPFSIMMSPSE